MKELIKYHGVKWIMLLVTIGLFTWDRVLGVTSDDSKASWFLALLILFQIRGILWEESYRKRIRKLEEEIK